jgi:hypothetical protein
LKATWTTQNVSAATLDLVIGDKPVIYQGSMNKRFVIALPLTQQLVFFAYSDARDGAVLSRTPLSRLVRYLNQLTCAQARRYVYAAHNRHSIFIARNLKGADL